MTEPETTYADLAQVAITDDQAAVAARLQIDQHADFESRLRYGLSEVLQERPELRDTLPLAAMLDDSVRWCA